MLSNIANTSLSTYGALYFPLLPMRKFSKVKKVKRVLIIDDDLEMSHLLKSTLQNDEKIKVTIAQDPFDAMDMMTDQAFDLIVIEWNLPKLNGLETLLAAERGFKFDPNLPLEWEDKKVPVVILTGCEKSSCKAPYTKHFRYLAYINKSDHFQNIVDNLRYQFQRT